MAKRGRKPIGKTIDDLDPSLRAQIDERILSAANESSAELFRSLGLASRGLLLDTFTRYAGRLRQQRQGEALANKLLSAPDHLTDPELIAKLKRMVLVDAVARLQAGDSKLYETMSLLARIQDFDRIEIERAAAKRAETLQDARLKKLEPEVKKAISEPTTQGSKDLRAILEAVQLNKLTLDEATREIGDVIWIEIDKQMRGGG